VTDSHVCVIADRVQYSQMGRMTRVYGYDERTDTHASMFLFTEQARNLRDYLNTLPLGDCAVCKGVGGYCEHCPGVPA
jgi:hypothetical protein